MRTTTTFTALDHIPDPVRIFIGRRIAEAVGAAVLAGLTAMSLALLTWSIQDPSLNHATSAHVHNWLGVPGAIVSDLAMQMFGLASIAILIPIAFWGWRLATVRRLPRPIMRLVLLAMGAFCASGVAALLPITAHWPLPTGLGGVVGDVMMALPRKLFASFRPALVGAGVVYGLSAVLLLSASVGLRERQRFDDDLEESFDEPPRKSRAALEEDDDDGEPGLGLLSLGALIHAGLSIKGGLARRLKRFQPKVGRAETPPPWARGQDHEFDAPFDLSFAPEPIAPGIEPPRFDASAYAPPAHRAAAGLFEPESGSAPARVIPAAPAPAPSQRALREVQPKGGRGTASTYQLPPLLLLTEAKKLTGTLISEDALQQNARLLEGVLEDFGVKGEIINVRPGPVVTLYELEPAPGIKSSRVIGLADDIARSMSAVSARVAVVSGRNAIGIELPNQRRETVFLRELLASQDFDKTKQSLAIALGKTIGGEPVTVDLAKMPHLLVAGTTGSGKSVAINTMILSLLYRLKPEQCRLIMVDPKMLELSVYDGIPHLLTPVVTDPKKAVVALKWAVREMEDRYKKMSKVGVRNIDGFNARVAEAAMRGEQLTRTVQTGYDRETGEAIYEHEAMELTPLPFIVVVVDEMADLMMVAGKDIEGAIQRLAQMARAAGIHLIMATQRPSVDVITGTIKANFPTRISFQVTSKIDSRTILGEMGAEQLLGQGDMLYMAGGGRISRVHGPFVSDGEVEKVVAHLKSQGQPDYLDAITADEDEIGDEGEAPVPGSMEAEESGDMYDRAVAIVLRDRKCSTSYIQRRLSVGYNKAASLVERMEKEGVVGTPNHSGKRTILVGGGIDRGAFELQGFGRLRIGKDVPMPPHRGTNHMPDGPAGSMMKKLSFCLFFGLSLAFTAQFAVADSTASSDPHATPPVTLSGSDADEAIKKADAFLSSSTTMVGDFVQNGADGRQSEGKIYIQKPGKLRFEYAAPAALEVIADGSTVAVNDRKMKTQNTYSIGNTPLKFLLQSKIDLKSDTQVLAVQKITDPERVMILLDDRTTFGGTSRIRLIFDAKTYELLQWQVRDPQGYETLVTLYNVDFTQKPDPKLFKISALDAAKK